MGGDKDRAEGTWDEAKGNVKEAVGRNGQRGPGGRGQEGPDQGRRQEGLGRHERRRRRGEGRGGQGQGRRQGEGGRRLTPRLPNNASRDAASPLDAALTYPNGRRPGLARRRRLTRLRCPRLGGRGGSGAGVAAVRDLGRVFGSRNVIGVCPPPSSGNRVFTQETSGSPRRPATWSPRVSNG